MSEQNHPWCRDVSRDEAIRRAEDAAAAERTPLPDHPDLPQAVKELRERVTRLEAFACAGRMNEFYIAVPQAPGDDPSSDPASRPAETEPPQPAPVPPADGLRTERVTPPWQRAKWDEALAIICDGGDWGRGNNFDHGVLGALVIWADKEMDRLTAERDAAIRERDAAREECDRLRAILPPESERGRGVGEGSWAVFAEKAVAERDEARADLATMRGKCDGLTARVAELEAAPAANAGGEANQEPWMVEMREGILALEHMIYVFRDDCRPAVQSRLERLRRLIEVWRDHDRPIPAANAGGEQPQRGWLTSEERRLIKRLMESATAFPPSMHYFEDVTVLDALAMFEAILARSTPPKVKMPPAAQGETPLVRDLMWGQAIREAGGEVQ